MSTSTNFTENDAEVQQHTASSTAQKQASWREWLDALKNIAPVYIGIHLACLVISALAYLFTVKDFYWASAPIPTLWQSWLRWDAYHYTFIAANGYDAPLRAAFFPLYPLLIRAGTLVTHSSLVSALIVSSLADLVLLAALYRLVKEDFDQQQAQRVILYISIFPTAFFLLAAYNESLFICLSVLCFYYTRRGKWWWAGASGFLACLTRSVGIFLLLPFCYEYLVQHGFSLKKIRLSVASGLLIPAGMGVFAIYCYYRFHDFLAFTHAQKEWNRALHFPWQGITHSIHAIAISSGFLSFQSLRNLTDLIPDLLFLLLCVLCFIGPWRFPRRLWAYTLYVVPLYLFLQLFPNGGTGLFPLESISRFMLELFPGFIILAGIGRSSKTFEMSYLMVSGAVFFFLLTQLLTNHWVL